MSEEKNKQTNEKNIVWQDARIKRDDRNRLLGFKNKVLWFTGLSGSGKSTVAHKIEEELNKEGILTYVLDGDNIRHGLNGNLGFSPEDRDENIRRVSEVAKLFYESGIMTLVCFISPYKKKREEARQIIGKDFVEIYVKCDVEECEKRDVKGLYKKVRAGEIKEFTGISAPYEEADNPEIILNTKKESLEESAKKVIDFLGI